MYKHILPGEYHPLIFQVKGFLKKNGYNVDLFSSAYDPTTVSAVLAFKKKIGLPENPVLSTALWGIIDNESKDDTVHETLVLPLSQITKEWIITDKTNVEGGYVFDKDDLGGETNHGITKKIADAYKKQLTERFNWSGKMIDLTREMAFYLYDMEFWSRLKLDDVFKIDPLLADKLFDICINIGTKRAGEWLQTYLNVMNNKGTLYPDIVVDGAVGNGTITALRSYIAKRGKRAIPRIILGMFNMQGYHYINISNVREANETFTYGWYSRMEHNLDYYYNNSWKM
jgi:lysozyme family protein